MNDSLKPNIADNDFDLKRYFDVIRRRRWIFIGTFVSIFLSIFIYTFFQTPIYRGTATLIIEQSIPKNPEIQKDYENNSAKDFYQTQYEILRSYTVAKKSFDILGLSRSPEFANKKDPVSAFRQRIHITPVRNSRLVYLSVDNADPEKAAEHANTVARVYIQHNLEDKQAESQNIFSWLSEQAAVLRAKVEKSELELLKFKEKEDIVSLEKRQILLEEKLSSLHESHNKAVTARMELETTLNEIKKIKENFNMAASLPRVVENSALNSLKKEYLRLDVELAKLSSKYKPKHPAVMSLQSQKENIRHRMIEEMRNIIKSLELEYRISLAKEEAIKKNLDALKRQSMELSRHAIEYGVLKRDAETNRQIYELLIQNAKEADVDGSITANNVRIIDQALTPQEPVRPHKGINLLLGFFLGLFFGTAFCFVTELLDNTLKSEEDVKLHFKLPCLGMIPIKKEGESSEIYDRAYRDLKTMLNFHRQENEAKTLLVMSTTRSEGKTSTVLALGKAFAASGFRVLLIDGDLFNPQLGKQMQVKKEAGLTEFFLKSKDLNEIILKTETPNLFITPAGQSNSNPHEIIGAKRMKSFLDLLKGGFDVIILDSPPISAAFETAVLASYVDGVAYVIRAGMTSRFSIKKMIARLTASNAHILGFVLTFADLSSSDLNDYYYRY